MLQSLKEGSEKLQVAVEMDIVDDAWLSEVQAVLTRRMCIHNQP